MSKIATCLWFDDQAEAAANFYVATFRACGQDAAIGDIARYGDAGPRPKGMVMTVTFTLAGQEFMALNGGPEFAFSPAISMIVKCADQAEIDRFWDGLSDGGKPVQCGWLTDRFGVSWQIVPRALPQLLSSPDAETSQRVMSCMMGMRKLVIAELEQAATAAV